MTAERDPYVVLGIQADATVDAVTAAYRSLARLHHPDVSQVTGAEQRMAEINAAWTLLRDPARRAAWDRAHGVVTPTTRGADGTAAASRPAGTPATGGHPGANGSATAPSQGYRPGGTAWRRGPDGEGAAGPPPGSPRGSVLPFGRHIGWSLGEIARIDPGYLVWLEGTRDGAPYRDEIDALLDAKGIRPREADRTQAKRGRA